MCDESRPVTGNHTLDVADESGTIFEQFLHGPLVDQVVAEENFSAETGERETVDFTFTDHQGTITEVVRWSDASDSVVVPVRVQKTLDLAIP